MQLFFEVFRMSKKSNRYRVRDDSGKELRKRSEPTNEEDKHSIRLHFRRVDSAGPGSA